MKHLLQHLVTGQPLSREQAHEAFELVMSGQATPAQIGAMLAMIQQRGPVIDEITAAARVMRAKLTPVESPPGAAVVDTCGMGGTGSRFFNISTAAGLVAAAAGRGRGVVVAKHGNRSVTSRSGSSQVLEHLGVKLDAPPHVQARSLAEAGFCFCYAPHHHAAMRHAGPVRQELGHRTIFNLVGPLTNPAGATRQVVGVPREPLVDLIAEVLVDLEVEHALVVLTRLPDGAPLGELATFGANEVAEVRHGMIKRYTLSPEELGLPLALPDSVAVEGPEQSAEVIREVLAGRQGPAADIVLINAAAALYVGGAADTIADALALAADAIASGHAAATLDRVVDITQAG